MAEARHSGRLPERPLSPHLQIYRFTWTMVMSILHRATGCIAYFAVPGLVLYLGAVASGRDAYNLLAACAGSWLGILVLVGLSWSLIHHAIGGIRHIVWDTGTGLDRASRFLWAQGTLVGSVVLTVLLWLVIFLGAL
ncbi:succinate dehydrogenase cytochrome b556 subunit [Terrihabitans soli]|uniref:Succinate dehydrogenase cytochrome b556 subunit n=1 Tax=Terrihabitans soli TaxID=708113 RepID=A0A6S6QKN5_9HYPH|nr:succinate dehydrogenase, cytochrome b556 subunit [Terrihabitans soli]BCJ89449.1 succinate dehydrogenase cytochrome b556 subunit [Terrihabitans soli]